MTFSLSPPPSSLSLSCTHSIMMNILQLIYYNYVHISTAYIRFTGLSEHGIRFIAVSAIIIIAFSIIRLFFELLTFIRQLHHFFADVNTWVEVPLFICSITFAAVFDRECFCPRDWQWQVGIAAVFLVWVDLILYMRRVRILGEK